MSAQSILAIETSVETGSVALLCDGKLACERSFLAGRKPSATLWPALEEVMAGVKSLDAIVIGIGPGSYNGSRVGIAAAQGIALVHDCRVAPLCSFEGVTPRTSQSLAVGDARRGGFSLQIVGEGRIEESFQLVNQEELVAAVSSQISSGNEVFSFDPATRFPLPPQLQEAVVRRQSEAKHLITAFSRRSPEEQETLGRTPAEPFYLRDPHITTGKRKSLLER